MRVCIHAVARARRNVLDKAQTKRAPAVLIALKLGDRGFGRLCRVESHDAGASRSSAGLVLYLGLFNLANGSEEFDEILVARRPGQLRLVSNHNRHQ